MDAAPARAPAPVELSRPMALLYDTRPRSGTPVFVGFSPRFQNRDEEEAAALLDAARDAVRYEQVAVSVVFISQRSGRGVGYAEAVETRIDEARAEAIAEDLEIVESVQDADGTVVVAEAPDLRRLPVSAPASAWGGSPPGWVDSRPRIPGYDVGVGVAGRLRRRSDSVSAADEEALAEIVLERAARLRAVADRRDVEGAGTAEQTTRAQEAADVVRGFYVLARWRSPDGRYYYSLAVAQQED